MVLKKAVNWICFLVLIVFIPVATVLSFSAIVASDQGFYRDQFRRYDRTEATGMNEEQLLRVTSEIVGYLFGDRQDLIIPVTIEGVSLDSIFNSRELKHMEDVKALFFLGNRLRLTSFALILLAIVLMIFLNGYKRGLIIAMFGVILASVVPFVTLLLIIWPISRNFDFWFNNFHLALFDNDLWILDPRTDMMINMFNQEFFANAGLRILLYSAAFMLLQGILALIVYMPMKRPETKGGLVKSPMK